MSDLSGEVIDNRYQLISQLASGGMASIYEALDLRLDRKVAVKIMHPHLATDEIYVERFIREAKSAALLSHPNVVAIQDQGWNEGGVPAVFIVMELIEGYTLRDLLAENGKLPLIESFRYINSILSALAAAHKLGIIHRDIKPENILISADGRLKVADFGLARNDFTTNNLTAEASVIMGSVSYLSPEQIERGISDHRSDLYSAGITLFEMVTGSKPFNDTTPLRIAMKHVNEEVPLATSLNPTLPAELDKIIAKATAKDPTDRYQSASEMANDIDLLWQKIDPRHPQASLELDVPRKPNNIKENSNAPKDGGRLSRSKISFGTPAKLENEKTPLIEKSSPQTYLATSEVEKAAKMVNQKRKSKAKESAGTSFRRVLLAILVLLVFFGFAYRELTSHKSLRLPSDIVGASASSAESELKSLGLTKLKITEVQNSGVASGSVIAVDPSQGAAITKSTLITLQVSQGGNQITIPTTANSSVADATIALKGAGLRVNHKVITQPSADVIPGLVVDSNPPAGTLVAPNSVVQLIVSGGIDTATAGENSSANNSGNNSANNSASSAPVKINNYVGKSADQALNELQALGMQPTTVSAPSATTPAGLVISQSPDGAAPVMPGTIIKLTVSAGSPIRVPNIYSLKVATAKALIQSAGLVAKVIGNLTNPNAVVVGVSPDSGNQVLPGSVITITVK